MSNPDHQPRRETRRIDGIRLVPYGDRLGDTVLDCDPSKADVQRALDECALEKRNYQIDLKELMSEWLCATGEGRDHDEWVRRVKGYHARRVAFFVKNGWEDPIVIAADGKIRDGSHRIRAAIFLGKEEIDVVVEP